MSTTDTIKKAQAALSRGDLSGARSLLDTAIDQNPADFEGRYTMAVLHRTTGEHSLAKEVLAEVLSEKTDFGRGFQELGYCELALKRDPDAQLAFEKAMELDASLLDSWRFVSALYQLSLIHS